MTRLTAHPIAANQRAWEHCRQRKHDAFKRWQASGYADPSAHLEWLGAYERMIEIAARLRKLGGTVPEH